MPSSTGHISLKQHLRLDLAALRPSAEPAHLAGRGGPVASPDRLAQPGALQPPGAVPVAPHQQGRQPRAISDAGAPLQHGRNGRQPEALGAWRRVIRRDLPGCQRDSSTERAGADHRKAREAPPFRTGRDRAARVACHVVAFRILSLRIPDCSSSRRTFQAFWPPSDRQQALLFNLPVLFQCGIKPGVDRMGLTRILPARHHRSDVLGSAQEQEAHGVEDVG